MDDFLSFTQETIVLYLHTHLASIQSTFTQFAHAFLHATHQHTTHAIQTLLQQHGLSTHNIPNATDCLAFETQATSTQPLLLYTPYQASAPTVEHARTIFVTLMALRIYQHLFPQLPFHVRWLLDGAGIHDDLHLQYLAQQQPHLFQASGCLWDATGQIGIEATQLPLLALGCKGLLRISLTAHTANAALPLMQSALVPDALWRLTWALNSIKNRHEEMLIDGFYDLIQSGSDAESASLYRLPNTAPRLAQQWGLPQLLLGLHGFQQHYTHLLMPTCTITAMQGGQPLSSTSEAAHVPTQAAAIVDFQLVPEQQPKSVFALLQDHLQHNGFEDITIQLLHASATMHTPLEHPFAQTVYQACLRVYDERLQVLPLTAGHLPLATLHTQLLPIVILSLGNEAIFIESIQQLISILGAWMTKAD